MVRRARQLLRGALLLGDVLDVGDRQHRALVLGERDPRASPHELAVAAEVSLIEAVRIDDAELEPGSVRHGSPHIVGMRELAQRVPDELIDLDAEHLGERLVGVDDAAVVDPHERHPGRGGVERLLETATGLLERPRVLLALGQVAQTEHHSPFGAKLVWYFELVGRVVAAFADVVRVPGAVERRLDEYQAVVSDKSHRCRFDDLAGHRPPPTGAAAHRDRPGRRGRGRTT